MFRYALTLGVGISVLAAHAAVAQHSCLHEDTLEAHVGHALWCWDDTPHQRGLLITAMVEGAVALKHAKLATAESADLEAIRAALSNVIHALSPETEPEGEGLGYGLILASEGAAVHIGFALEAETMFSSDGSTGEAAEGDALDAAIEEIFDEQATGHASEYVMAQAELAKQSLANATAWSHEALAAAEAALAAPDAAQAAAGAQEVLAAIVAAMRGRDIDGDGVISLESGEGGLDQAHEAMMAIVADGDLTQPPAHGE